jgi:hypothetical protein
MAELSNMGALTATAAIIGGNIEFFEHWHPVPAE